jgi:hypothetical protein
VAERTLKLMSFVNSMRSNKTTRSPSKPFLNRATARYKRHFCLLLSLFCVLILAACDGSEIDLTELNLHQFSITPGCYVRPPENLAVTKTTTVSVSENVSAPSNGFTLLRASMVYNEINEIIERDPKASQWQLVADQISNPDSQGQSPAVVVPPRVSAAKLPNPNAASTFPEILEKQIHLWRVGSSSDEEINVTVHWDMIICEYPNPRSYACTSSMNYGHLKTSKASTVFVFHEEQVLELNHNFLKLAGASPVLRGCDPVTKISFESLKRDPQSNPSTNEPFISSTTGVHYIVKCWNQNREAVSCEGVDLSPTQIEELSP